MWVGLSAILSIGATVFVLTRSGALPPEPDVATAWNTSIGRLGLWPVYPPEEDIYVGDLWAVLVTGDASKDTPLQSSAVRMLHLDLTDKILADQGRRLRLMGVVAHATGAGAAEIAEEPGASEATSEIRPTLVAFPGITITHGRSAATAFGTGWFGWGAADDGTSTETLKLTDTYAYGVPISDGVGALSRLCDTKAKGLCDSDAYPRRLLARAGIVGAADYSADGKTFRNRVELRLVTRAFLVRTIEQRRDDRDARGLTMRISPNGAATPPSGMGRSRASEPSSAASPTGAPPAGDVARTVRSDAQGTSNGMGLATGQTDQTVIESPKTVYPRPLVFAYRAVSILLAPMDVEREIKP